MTVRFWRIILCFFSISSLIVFTGSGCAKEYSFENRPIDTLSNAVNERDYSLAQCAECIMMPEGELGKWSFVNGNTIMCGKIDTAIVNNERTAFTFFGPSICSIDTGAILTIYLPVKLDRDLQSLPASVASFHYYDNVKPSAIFITSSRNPFVFTLDSYSHLTKRATGRFSGLVFREDSSTTTITNGRFLVELK